MARLTLILAVLLLLLPVSAHAVVLIDENYEVNAPGDLTAKGWAVGQNCNAYCTLAIVPAPPGRSGSVLRMEYRGLHGGDDSHNAKIGRGLPNAPEIYGRYYKRTDPVPPATQSTYYLTTSKQHYLKTDGSALAPSMSFYTAYIWGGRDLMFVTQNTADMGASLTSNDYSNGAKPMADGRWYCVEYHYKMNTPGVANGVQEMWIDGFQTLGNYNRNFRDLAHATTAFTIIEIYRQAANDQYRYEDDFVLATTRVGCSGPPQPGDTTPPTTPAGFVVR